MSTWMGGAAVSPFPIADGTPLTGYAAREGPTTGTLDPLTTGVLVLEREGARLVIVAADVAAVDAALVQEIAAAANIEPSELALCASHTHSGPAGVVPRLHPANPNELDPELRARFVTLAAGAITAARSGLQPVDLLFGQTEVEGVAANRNVPAIPADARLSVLATRRGDGSLQCVVVHFACHPTILGADSRMVSADFPGALRRHLGKLLPWGRNEPVVLFVNGAAGDISTRFTRRAQDATEVDRLGGLLAAAANDALRTVRPLPGPLRHGSSNVTLTPRSFPSSPTISPGLTGEGAVDVQTRDHWQLNPTPTLPSPSALGEGLGVRASREGLRVRELQRIIETRAQGAAMLTALAALPEGAIATRCDLDVWMLGDLALVSVPAELFSSFGSQIADASDDPTLVLGYSNGYIGYLADRRAHEAATYEALASPYGPESGELVTSAATALVSQLRSNRKAAGTSG
jgi:hypothetical protein